MEAPYAISTDEIKYIHSRLLEETIGLNGVRMDSLDSLVLGSRFQEDQSIEGQAAYWLSHLAKGHYFTDCNKRTAYFTVRYILLMQGLDLDNPDVESTVKDLCSIAAAPNMDSAFELAQSFVHKSIVENGRIPNRDLFDNIVLRNVGLPLQE